MSNVNRESWLNQAIDVLRDGVFKPRDYILPPLKVSVGLPFARNQRDRLIDYYGPANSADGIGQVYVSPLVDDGRTAINLLFGQCAAITGYPDAFDAAATIAEVLGAYPQAAITLPDYHRQPTRMLKCSCDACGYVIRTVERYLKRSGPPLCPCNQRPMNRESR